MKKSLAALLLLLLIGCTHPESSAQTVYLIQSDYAIGLKAELAYSNLPRCGKPTSPPVCSKADTIKKVQNADNYAWIAIQEAQVAVRTSGYGLSKITTTIASAKALTDVFVSIATSLPKE